MSAFQKKAVLKRASALSLEPVAEVPSSASPSDTSDKEGRPEKDGHDEEKAQEDSHRHASQTEAFLESCKSSVLAVRETYENPENGLSFSTYYSPPKTPESPLFVCHHGAGSSAMTFWCLAQTLARNWPADGPGMFAFDARGHGGGYPDPGQYHLADFTSDFRFILREFLRRHQNPTNPMCLVGHSLGGAVLTDFVGREPNMEANIKGLIVIDIVEETAVQSLVSISAFLSRRPKSFGSYGEAIQWHLQSRLLRNEESAKVSVPDLLFSKNGAIFWKANLADMANSWHSWFAGLSQKFLDCSDAKSKIAKLLILSSNETLDRALTIGQMQGKFQLIVFNNSTNAGHFLHEDIPQQIATSIMEFMRRFNGAQGRQQRQIPSWGGKINT